MTTLETALEIQFVLSDGVSGSYRTLTGSALSVEMGLCRNAGIRTGPICLSLSVPKPSTAGGSFGADDKRRTHCFAPAPKPEVYENQLHQIPGECRGLEIGRVQAARGPVIGGQRRGDDRAVGPVRWQNTEGSGVGEELRYVVQVANVRIQNNGMNVIEVENVVEVAEVDQTKGEHQAEQQNCFLLASAIRFWPKCAAYGIRGSFVSCFLASGSNRL